jgi:hypothetical protein
MKERHVKSWLTQGSTLIHTKLKVSPTTVSKSMSVRNVAIATESGKKF